MSTLNELEVRLRRTEKRWDESDRDFHEAMNEIARFHVRITRVTSLALAVATAVALRVFARYWVHLSELWSTAFALAFGVIAYAALASWLDRWRVHERDEQRRRYVKK